MSHLLESMFYVKEVPWHGLGVKLDNPPTIAEAIQLAGLDWQVAVEDLYTISGEKSSARTVRRLTDRRELGTVGQQWQPLQNDKAFDFFQPFVDKKLVVLETAGSLAQGGKIWILAKIVGDPMVVQKGDEINKYILLYNGHDGLTSVGVGFTPIRVVCNNTLSMAASSSASKIIKIRHGINIVQNVEKLRETIDLANQEFQATLEQYQYLASQPINGADLEKYVKLVLAKKTNEILQAEEELIASQRIVNNIVEVYESGKGAASPDTYWKAYNAINEYNLYYRGRSENNRINNMWFGQGATLDKKALNVALTLTK